MQDTVVIRARRTTRELLHELAHKRGTTVIDALEKLVSEASDAELLSAVTSDLSCAPSTAGRTPADAALAAWDATLADGLDPDEDFSSWQ